MKFILKLNIIFVLVFIVSAVVFPQVKSEKITQYVSDETGTLSSEEVTRLGKMLKAFEDSTSNQVVVYIIRSLNGMPIEDVAYKIAEKNGIGQKGKNNGVLLLVAIEDKRLRIEVGYGLEGALPDALCGRIIDDEIKPEFRSGNYYEGILNGINAIISATRGEYKPESKNNKIFGCPGSMAIVMVIFAFIFLFSFIRIILNFFGLGKVYSGKIGGRSNDSGPWFWGSGGSSGFSGGSFGGFSGGGGSFGGGGASGSW